MLVCQQVLNQKIFAKCQSTKLLNLPRYTVHVHVHMHVDTSSNFITSIEKAVCYNTG